MSDNALFSNVLSVVVQESLSSFKLVSVEEHPTYISFRLEDSVEKVPVALKNSPHVVLDGYCDSVDTLSHSFACKPIYLRLFRRRWKRVNSDEHLSNEYDFRLKGVKMVPELGIFLKEGDRRLSC